MMILSCSVKYSFVASVPREGATSLANDSTAIERTITSIIFFGIARFRSGRWVWRMASMVVSSAVPRVGPCNVPNLNVSQRSQRSHETRREKIIINKSAFLV